MPVFVVQPITTSALQVSAAKLQTQSANLNTQKVELQGQQQQATTQQQQAEQLQSELTDELTKAGGDERGTDPRLVTLQDGLGSTEGCCSRSSATSHRPPADPHCAGPDLQSGGDELAGTGTRIGSDDRARDDLRRRDHRDDGFDGLLRRLLATRAHDVVPPYAILQRFRPLG